MVEQWRDVVGFEGRYQVSDAGRLRNVRTGRVQNGRRNAGGYRIVDFTVGPGRVRSFYLHRLVCIAFHGPAVSPSLVVNHLNGNKLDCRAANLSWCTRAENNAHAAQHGLTKGPRGVRNHRSKFTDELVVEMRRRSRHGTPYAQMAREAGTSVSAVYKAVIGRTWRHVRDGLGSPTAVSEFTRRI